MVKIIDIQKAVAIPINPPITLLFWYTKNCDVLSTTTINTPINAIIIAVHSKNEYFCLRKNIDKKAEKIGAVAIEVNTIKTDEFIMPIVKAIDWIQDKKETRKNL